MPATESFVQPAGDGIHVIDTGFQRPRFDASYLIVEDGRTAFIDTGTNHSVPRLLAALEAQGLARRDVDFVIVTHIHLDHAGGAGLLMSELPRARLVVHPRGARHLVYPRQLIASATAVYGADEVAASYGEIVGVDKERVLTTHDGMTLALAGRPLVFIDTPGHARHHHCIWDACSRGFFAGDTFGISYREFDTEHGAFAFPSATPTHFEPEPLKASVRRLLGFDPRQMFLTHYGPVPKPDVLAALLIGQIDAIVSAASALVQAPERHAALKRMLERMLQHRLDAHGCGLPEAERLALLATDVELNAQGIGLWLDQQALR
jgi:glyoxylase-like metal-dependent hydrolase (beta-lactamase superfamily II)